ncbi:MAG: hypothetical protein ACRC28_06600 [Clostridium sp.]|uniref:hypothetical protein n=1 Tax=Clostridium sp. TaxID=1506 RepID=UPI003F3253B4
MACEQREQSYKENRSFFRGGKKRNIVLLIVGIFLMLGITGCAGNEYIETVKTGSFNNYPNVKVGDAFKKFFKGGDWEYFESDEGKNVVEFTGECTYFNEEVDAVVQFQIYDDNTFELTYFSINDVSQNEMMIYGLIEAVMDEYSK